MELCEATMDVIQNLNPLGSRIDICQGSGSYCTVPSYLISDKRFRWSNNCKGDFGYNSLLFK